MSSEDGVLRGSRLHRPFPAEERGRQRPAVAAPSSAARTARVAGEMETPEPWRLSGRGPLEHDLPFDGPRREELQRLARLEERKGPGDHRVDLLLREEREHLREILPERGGILPVPRGDPVEAAAAAAQAEAVSGRSAPPTDPSR